LQDVGGESGSRFAVKEFKKTFSILIAWWRKEMKLAEGMRTAVFAGIVGAGLLLSGDVAKAQGTDLTGEYDCTEAKVAGKSVLCKAAQLSLKSDGRFELQGREGQYMVAGSWVELTGNLLKSRAKIEAGHKIVFRFYNKKGLCEIIYERRVAELGKTKLG
jgi:hypothetical protein